ncbi:GH17029 [Drosophila grimshawi]|uniref:GH17029 n=2 Tax=Drosophila grimshawi TaxID=7222 RepID=B4IZ23_DROGR|nr:GH17029 [Drosophila grimshawi]
MNRIHVTNSEPKYQSGKWSWDDKGDALHFEQHFDLEHADERYMDTNGYQFLRTLNPTEEVIFRKKFVRPHTTYDTDTVVINDVRDLVLFLMPKEFLSKKFLSLIHQPAVHRLIHSLIIYFEYFLRMVEFTLIRRDELACKMAQVQSEQTNEMKRIFSTHLRQYRMLVARNYCMIISGEGDLKKFYHTKEIVNISSKIKDRALHEQLLAVLIQIVWITMHRRAYFIIEMEMNRLFRSEHFLMNRKEYIKFTPVERSLLFGRNYKIFNYRVQCSPLIQDLKHVDHEDMPLLWIGERKYRGSDHRIAEVELEYIVPGPQLHLIDVSHGILGHPKKLYNTILSLDWPSVRYANFSEENDPYYIIRQPNLRIPNINEMHVRKLSQIFEHNFKIFRIYEECTPKMLMNWSNREQILEGYQDGISLLDIAKRFEQQLADEEGKRKISAIVADFSQVTHKMRKKKISIVPSDSDEMGGTDELLFAKEGDDYFFKS